MSKNKLTTTDTKVVISDEDFKLAVCSDLNSLSKICYNVNLLEVNKLYAKKEKE